MNLIFTDCLYRDSKYRNMLLCSAAMAVGACLIVSPSRAESPDDSADSSPVNVSEETLQEKEAALVSDFVKRMRISYGRANVFLQKAGLKKEELDLRGLPDGEFLILSFKLSNRMRLDSDVIAEVHNQDLYLSFADVISVLDFPIEYDEASQSFSGWFINESFDFTLDLSKQLVVSKGVDYDVKTQLNEGEDVYFPLSYYESWFGVKLDPDIADLEVGVRSSPPLPLIAKLQRRGFEGERSSKRESTLPRSDNDGYKLIAVPQVDVSSTASYSNPDGAGVSRSHNVNLRTSGDFAYGNLTTNISGRDEEGVTSARVTYMQESRDPDILGPLKARRLELGDVQPTRVPITGGASPETGVRITNKDPLVSQTLPSTQISGYILPGWDLELYRDNALIAVQDTDENGYYSFDDVRLFSDRNFFRVVAYGPQGERREREVSVPYDPSRDSDDTTVYDVSLSFQNEQFYNATESEDEDRGTPHLAGFIETPIGNGSALRLGGRVRDESGEQKVYASAALATSYRGAVLDLAVASDEQGELASELSAIRQFGPHSFRADLDLYTEGYQTIDDAVTNIVSNSYNIEGPLPLGLGVAPRYGLRADYTQSSDGEKNISGGANLSTSYRGIGFNQGITFNDVYDIDDEDDSDTNTDDDGPSINSQTVLSGRIGKDNFRGRMNYQIEPDPQLESLFASWRRRFSNELDGQLEVEKNVSGDDLTTLSAQMNWQPSYVRISPRISRNNKGDVSGLVTTSFAVAKSPDPGGITFTRDFITNSGVINALVFWDKDGDGIYNNDDETIPNAVVRTPQNGGGGKTDENGVALITMLRPNIVTDVYVEDGSLDDPFWIPASEGVSVMPRTGTNIHVDIPIVLAGEIDGTVYLRNANGDSRPLRNVQLALHSEDGELVETSRSEGDGFYLFSLIPPGRYALSVKGSKPLSGMSRPRPQLIEIGYDGTTLFGNDIVLQADDVDVPTEILADMDDFKSQHPHIDFASKDYEVSLNLGEYNSRLYMSFMWYRLKERYGALFDGTQIYVEPSQSYALPKTGKHVLRVGVDGDDLDGAYRRCRALAARGFACKVDVFPTARTQTVAVAE